MSTNAAATRSFLNINYNKKAAIYNIVSSEPSQSDYSTVSQEIVNEKSTTTSSSSTSFRNVLAFSKLAATLSAFISTKGTLAASTATATATATNATTILPSAIPLHPTKPTPTTNIITNSKRPTIIIYPTVSPESIVIPIVSCILGFPLLALLVICCLRRRAKLARERDRRRNYDMQDHAVSLVRFSPIHRLNNRSSRAISLRPERSLSRGFPSLELDTVIEERSDPEQTQTDIISPESPLDPHKFRDFNSS